MIALPAAAAAPNGTGTYYQNANGKNGAALKTALCGIIIYQSPAKVSYNGLWEAFKSTDVRSDGKIWDMYSNITNYTPVTSGSSYTKEGDCYNREHSFPKSWFGGDVSPMYSDLNHLYPTDGKVNQERSNHPFGETNNPTYSSANSFSKVGPCSVSGYSGTVFEPNDEYKGDFARTYFYMVTCYENQIVGWYTNNNDPGVKATLNGTTYPGFQPWQLNMLLAWAAADPVSDKEIARNNAVYRLQGNRNPFIDYPGLEQYVWGSKKDVAFSYDSYVQPDGSGTSGGEETGQKVITIAYNDIPDGYGANGTSGSFTKTVRQANDLTITYAGINTKSSASAADYAYGYAMFVKDNGYVYSSTVPEGYYPSKVTVTFSSSTGISGKAGITFGTTVVNTRNTGVNGAVSQNGTCELTNSDETKKYWNFSTTGANVQVSNIKVTYSPVSPVLSNPTTYDLATQTPYGSPFTLVNGTHFTTDGAVTLSSDNESIASVNGLTITPVAVGSTTIRATYSAGASYRDGSSTFTFTVTQPEAKTSAKPAGTSALLFGESFGDNSGSQRDWNNSYSVKSGVEAVYNGITGYSIVNAKQGKNNTGSTLSGLNQTTQGTDASIIIGPLHVADYSNLQLTYQWKAGSIKGTYSTSAYYAINSTGSYTELPGTGTGATTFVERSYTLPATAQIATLYLKIVWNTSNTQAIIDEVQLTGAANTALTATLNAYGYATYCSEYPLSFTNADGYTAWQVTSVDGSAITFRQVVGTVKGGTGLLLMGTPGATVTLNSVASSNELGNNKLYGTLAPTYVGADEYYGLSGDQFVKVNAGTVKAGKALLPASAVDGNEVKALSFVFEGVDGISERVTETTATDKTTIFNLAGQRLTQPRRGVNIIGGKKVIIR